MPEFFGLCGRNSPRPCKIAWASTYANKVGVYPSDLLPSTRTIWHASSDGAYTFTAPIISPGETFGLIGGGGVILGGLTGSGLFSVQFDVFAPQMHVILIFARSANRLNVAHVITAADIANLDAGDGGNKIAEINVGEFVFEFVSVTDAPVDEFNTELTPQEIEEIEGRETESDRSFRKLFEQDIANNRFKDIKKNDLGVEYRLDNAGPKATSALDLAGQGDLFNTSYRDGTSRVIEVDFSSAYVNPTTGVSKVLPDIGDVIYLSYVAVREHYIRQSINVKFALNAISLPPQCFGFPSDITVSQYRFYNWEIENPTPGNLPLRLSGWRAVESFNANVSVSSPVLAPEGFSDLSVIGDFLIGGGQGLRTVSYLPTDITLEQLEAFLADKSTLPTYTVDLRNKSGDASYSVNQGPVANPERFSFFSSYRDATEHVFFNVHPLALKKRDVDKIGIDRFTAQQLVTEVQSGKLSLFPFMDDPDVVNPFDGSNQQLSSSNMKFEPIEPVTIWNTVNAETECGVVGGVALGDFSGGFGDVLAIFAINSPIITERFEKDTRILVEQHATFGGIGKRFVAIEGAAGLIGATSCIRGRNREDAFAFHINDDNFLSMNRFTHGHGFSGMRNLTYRPDIAIPITDDNADPRPEQIEPLVGYNRLLADAPGRYPGETVSVSNLSEGSLFVYKSTSPVHARQVIRESITDDQIVKITIPSKAEQDKQVIPISTGFYGTSYIDYSLSGPDAVDIMLLFKVGGGLEGTVDSVRLNSGTDLRVIVPHKWQRADTVEIVGNLTDVVINNYTVSSLNDSISNDFLNEQSSSTTDNKQSDKEPKFYSKSVLFETEVMSIGEDLNDRLFVFFNDKDNAISCAQSNDRGQTWIYHYGIVEPIEGQNPEFPFVVNSFKDNSCFLFFLFSGKILCKTVPFDMFRFEDSMLIERFEADRFVPAESGEAGRTSSLSQELLGLFSNDGKGLRREQLSYVAAGDMTDVTFLGLLGKDPDTNVFTPNELRSIESIEDDSTVFSDVQVRKNPIARGTTSAFTSNDVQTLHFSAYRTEKGEMRLFFLSLTKDASGGGNQLQCHFSIDDGTVWYDLWEFIEHQYNRMRVDGTNNSVFIDRDASGEPISDIRATDPIATQEQASFGINVHWSRLKRHKVDTGEGVLTVDSESQVLEIESPYAFYHPTLNSVFLFYVYQGCLLCKIFGDSIFANGAFNKRKSADVPDAVVGMDFVKRGIERDTQAEFIDGDLSVSDIREEIEGFVNTETNERMNEGNILFPNQFGIDQFNEDRRIGAQRVCAYALSNCNVRVFYKSDGSVRQRASLWNGGTWMPEDMMRDPSGLEPVELSSPSNILDVVGGFGGTGF